jgi:hypothetical protein
MRTIFFLTRQSDTEKLNLFKADQEVLLEVNAESEGSKCGPRRLWEGQSIPSSDREKGANFPD